MKPTLPLAIIPAVLCLAQPLAVLPAQAQLARTYVSAASGNDANDCSLATPCRSFQGAHDKTLDQGEITVLAAGGYGAVTITKSVSIVNDGVGEASILVSGGTSGITINGGPGTAVNLRGLTVQGIGFGGGTGLTFGSGAALTIAGCVFRNHTDRGIFLVPNVSGSHASVSIADTLVADNGHEGIRVQPNATDVTAQVVIDNVRTLNNSTSGVWINGGATFGTGAIMVTITNSVSANNGQRGFLVSAALSPTTTTSLTLIQSTSANNVGAGLELSPSGAAPVSLRVGQSIIAGNARTWVAPSNTVVSFGDNYIVGNADGDPAPPPLARK